MSCPPGMISLGCCEPSLPGWIKTVAFQWGGGFPIKTGTDGHMLVSGTVATSTRKTVCNYRYKENNFGSLSSYRIPHHSGYWGAISNSGVPLGESEPWTITEAMDEARALIASKPDPVSGSSHIWSLIANTRAETDIPSLQSTGTGTDYFDASKNRSIVAMTGLASGLYLGQNTDDHNPPAFTHPAYFLQIAKVHFSVRPLLKFYIVEGYFLNGAWVETLCTPMIGPGDFTMDSPSATPGGSEGLPLPADAPLPVGTPPATFGTRYYRVAVFPPNGVNSNRILVPGADTPGFISEPSCANWAP
jgi:hypothetical protein